MNFSCARSYASLTTSKCMFMLHAVSRLPIPPSKCMFCSLDKGENSFNNIIWWVSLYEFNEIILWHFVDLSLFLMGAEHSELNNNDWKMWPELCIDSNHWFKKNQFKSVIQTFVSAFNNKIWDTWHEKGWYSIFGYHVGVNEIIILKTIWYLSF